MDITFKNIQRQAYKGKGRNVTFDDSELVRGDVVLRLYGKADQCTEVCRTNLNIPLFLSEMELFLHRVKAHDRAIWRITFAPFLAGRMEGSDLLISRKNSKSEEIVLETLDAQGTKDLRNMIRRFQDTFGYLEPSPDAASRPDY